MLADPRRFPDHDCSHVTMHLETRSGTIAELFETVERFAAKVLPAARGLEARPLQ